MMNIKMYPSTIFCLLIMSLFIFFGFLEWNYSVHLILIPLFFIVTFFTFKKLEYGFLFVLSDLFTNAHGQLLSINLFNIHLSLREIIFLGFFLGASKILFQHKQHFFSIIKHPLSLLFFSAIGCGILFGIFNNELKNVFSDSNAYFFLFYLFPLLILQKEKKDDSQLFSIILFSSLFQSILGLIIFFLFSHIDATSLQSLYRFLRDTRIFEITVMESGFVRIFAQTHIWIFLSFLFLFVSNSKIQILSVQKKYFINLIMILFSSLIMIGMSRSFLLSLVIVLISYVLVEKFYFSLNFKSLFKITQRIFASFFLGYLLIFMLINVPISKKNIILQNSFSQRYFTQDVAIQSRYQLLGPLFEHLKNYPFGSGFGTHVSYISNDPRARAINEDGRIETMSFEWGWIELWVKMGLLGPLFFLFLGSWLIYRFWFKTDDLSIKKFAITSIIFLFVTHFFTPYLNHPLGLSHLLFFMFICRENQKKNSESVVFDRFLDKKIPSLFEMKPSAILNSKDTH